MITRVRSVVDDTHPVPVHSPFQPDRRCPSCRGLAPRASVPALDARRRRSGRPGPLFGLRSRVELTWCATLPIWRSAIFVDAVFYPRLVHDEVQPARQRGRRPPPGITRPPAAARRDRPGCTPHQFEMQRLLRRATLAAAAPRVSRQHVDVARITSTGVIPDDAKCWSPTLPTAPIPPPRPCAASIPCRFPQMPTETSTWSNCRPNWMTRSSA